MMHRRRFLQASGLSAAALTVGGSALAHCGSCATDKKPAGKQPNVILILVDDMGFGDPQCYNAKSLIPTPNIDALATAGMRFTDAHSPSSVCTPTRYGILTGRYCWRTRLKKAVLWEWDSPLIAKDRLTMGKMFQSLGYSTACVGKWHLGEDWSRIRTPLKKGAKPPKGKTVFKDKKNSATYDFTQPILEGPNERGFDYYFGTSVPNFPPYCFIENDHTVGIPTLAKPDTMFGHPGPMIKGWDLTQIMPGLFNKANSWVKTEAAKKDKPFFLYLPLTGPHTPIAPTKEFQGKTKAGWYGDFIHQIDHHIGTLMKTLADSGEADNTLVIFTSDNGSPARLGTGDMAGNKMTVHKTGHIPAGDWRGLKSDAWEGGHRVPFIVVWPGKTPAGKTSKEPISSVDLIATLAAVTGYTLPDTTAQDSHNLLDLFTGKPVGIDAGKPALREAIVHHSGGGMFCLRQGSWKLICGLGSGGFSGKGPASLRPKGAKGQLYNLKLDPKENDNLWLKQPKKVAKLTAILNKYKKTGRSAPLRHKK